jgi:hypothetical protein
MSLLGTLLVILGAIVVASIVVIAVGVSGPRPVEARPRRSAAWAIPLAAGWFLAIFAGLGGIPLAFTDVARRELATEVCGRGNHIYVGHQTNGRGQAGANLYCGPREGAFRDHAGYALVICGLAGAAVPSGLGVLIALGLLVSRRLQRG